MPETPDNLSSSVNIDAESVKSELQARSEIQSQQEAQDLQFDLPHVSAANAREWASASALEAANQRARMRADLNAQLLGEGSAPLGTGSMFSAPADAGASFVDPRFQAAPQAEPGPQWNTWDPNDAAWKARGMGLDFGSAGSGFAPGATLEDTSAPWYGGDEEAAAPGLSDRVRGFLRDRYAAPSASTTPRYADYDSARQAEQDLLEGARNKYTAEGRYSEIGGEGFNAEVNEAKVSMGLASAEETPGFLSRYGRSLRGGGAFGIGYGLMQGGEAIARSQELSQSGQFVTPEQQDKAAAGILPAAGLIGGSLIGAAIPGIGPILGGFGGQAVMSGVAGSIGAGDDRAQASREAADRLAESLGSASQSIDTFRGQIEATGAPVQQLGQGLLSLQGFGAGVGSSAVAGAGRMALAEGTDYLKDTQAIGSFLASSPGRYQMLDAFAQNGGELSGTDFRGIARDALFEGNFGAYNAAQQGAAAVRVRNDPGAQSAEREISKDSTGAMSLAYDAEDWLGVSNNRSRARITLNNRQAELTTDDGSAGDRQYSLNVGAARLALTRSEADLSGQQAGYGLASVGGAAASDLARLLPGMGASVGRAVGADQSLIGLLDPNNPDDALKIARLQADQGQRRLGFAQTQRENFQRGLGEEEAGFGLSVVRSQIEGRSAADIYGDTQRQSRFLQGVEGDPANPLSPTERAGIESGRLSLVYGARSAVYDQNIAGADSGIARAGAGVDASQRFGTPGQIDQAFGGQIDAFGAKIRELAGELSAGGLTVSDRIAKERELTDTQRALVDAEAQRRDAAVQSSNAIAGDRVTDATAGQSRRISLFGSAGNDPSAAIDAFAGQVQTDRDNVGRYAPGTRGYEDAVAKLRADEAAFRDEGTRLLTYSPSARDRTSLSTAQTDFDIARIAPYSGGPDSNPLTMGNALLGQLQGRLTGIDSFDRRTQAQHPDEMAHEANVGQENALRLQIAELREQQQQAQFGALPEMIAGSPGRGVGAALIAPAALSARFSPNANVGSWGGGPLSGEGGEASGGSTEANRYLAQISGDIRTLVQHAVSGGGARGFQPTVPNHPVNSVATALGFGLNPYQE